MQETKNEKKRYWLKLDKNFLKSPQMKVIKSMPNGKDYIIFYLSLMLESIETVGHLRFTSLVPYNDDMLAAITDTNIDIVRSAVKIFCELGLMKIFDDGTIFLPEVPAITGKESESAERVRNYRKRLQEREEVLALPEAKKQPKTNAQRQKQFRAKKNCEEKQHIPYIEDYLNNKRYNGNYYVVIQRDKFKCAICGSIENLCVHHIDGYDENKPENSCTNKMITLCRNCHSNVHSGILIDEDTLNSIEYYEESNEMLQGNADVTKCNNNKEKEKDKDKNKDKESIKRYGEYQNVFFTDKQYEKLIAEFPNTYQDWIERLDGYIQQEGKKYKDCLATIKNWARKDKERGNNSAKYKGNIKKTNGNEFAEFS